MCTCGPPSSSFVTSSPIASFTSGGPALKSCESGVITTKSDSGAVNASEPGDERVGGSVGGARERAELREGAGVEQGVDPLARVELAAPVMPVHAFGPAHLATRCAPLFEPGEDRLPRVSIGSIGHGSPVDAPLGTPLEELVTDPRPASRSRPRRPRAAPALRAAW